MGKNKRFSKRNELAVTSQPEEAELNIVTEDKSVDIMPIEDAVKADEAIQTTQKELVEALKKDVSERAKGLEKTEKVVPMSMMAPKSSEKRTQKADINPVKAGNKPSKTVGTELELVKTPFGDGYFVSDLPLNSFTCKKTTVYKNRVFVLKGDLELKNS